MSLGLDEILGLGDAPTIPMSGLVVPAVDELDTCAAALAYAEGGFYLVPVLAGSKHPGSRVGRHWQTRSTRDRAALIAQLAGTDDGIALHLGPARALAIDVDRPAEIPEPLEQAIAECQPPFQQSRPGIPGRGHYLFAVPEGRDLGNSTGALGKGWGEIRGHNGVIIVAPSIHENADEGAAYRWVRTGPVPVLPEYVADLLPERTEATDAVSDAAVRAFLDRHTAAARPELANGWGTTFTRKVRGGASRHDSMVSVCTGALKEAAAGLVSAPAVVEVLRGAFLAAVTDTSAPGVRSAHLAAAEWSGILRWAVAQAAAANPAETLARVADRMPPAPTVVDRVPLPPPNLGPETGEIRTAEQVPAPQVNLPAEWWEARPILRQISDAAHARAMSRDAVLGAVLARVSFATPYLYRLPPIIGSPGSLNLMVALIGGPGTGKSTGKRVAMDLIQVAGEDLLDDVPPGSGEGLIDAYFELVEEKVDNPEGGKAKSVKVKRQTKRALFAYVDEGESLTDRANRKGETLFSTLRTAWSGATLGQSNAGTETKRILPDSSYRCSVVVGFQPSKAVALLDDVAGGTPQRYLWFSATDPAVPLTRSPHRFTPLDWTAPPRITLPYDLDVASTIQDRIYAEHVAVHRGDTTLPDLDSHGNLVHLKTAALLAILDERLDVTEEDWALAAQVMDTSRAVRASIQAIARAEQQVAEHRSIERQIRRDAATSQAAEIRALDRAARRIATHVHNKTAADHQCRRRCLQQSVSDIKDVGIQAALDEAESRGWIVHRNATYLPGETRPA